MNVNINSAGDEWMGAGTRRRMVDRGTGSGPCGGSFEEYGENE